MMEIDKSDIVIPLFGRDKGRYFFVLDRDDTYALICDGKLRRVEKPKRKKLKHMRFEARHDCRAAVKLRSGGKVTNSEIRRSLAEYVSQKQGEKGGMFNGKG